MAGSRFYVESPTPTPLPFGLLSVADSRSDGGHWQQGVEYDSDNCVVTLATAAGYCIQPAGNNERQTITITGGPTGGSFTLSVYGETTAAIPYNATAAQVKTALENLTAFNPGDITTAGGPLPATPVTVDWTGVNYGSRDIPLMAPAGSFTGGSSPGVGVATTTAGLSNPKTLTNPGATIVADPFTVYLIRQCAPVGDSEAQARAMKMFNGSEGVGVEKGFWSQITASGAGAVDLTGGTTKTNPAIGLALLEQYAASHYGGRPTIHVSRDVASLLGTSQSIERHGNHMETKLGALVSAGGGYDRQTGPAGATATATEGWMFVTGQVSMFAGPANVQGPIVQLSAAQSNNPVNQWITMVERTYLTSPDCMIAAVKVTLATV